MPFAKPVIPQPIAQGVFGMARMTGASRPRYFSISCVETEATTETISLPGFISGLISSSTSRTAWGFTASSTILASRTAARLSVDTSIPKSLARARAFSACRTVACTRLGCTSFCSRNARSRIPPIFPAPSTASRPSKPLPEVIVFPEFVVFMVTALLTTQRRPSTFFVEDLILWFFFVIRGREIQLPGLGDSLSNVSEYSDGFYRAGQRPLSIGVDFHAKARVNPSHFAEAASEGGSSKSGGSQLGEKLSASNQDCTTRAVDNHYFVDAV